MNLDSDKREVRKEQEVPGDGGSRSGKQRGEQYC